MFLDVIGAGFALLATVLFVYASVWAWPVSLVAIAIDFVLYYRLEIYGDMMLQCLYGVLSLYGWWRWRQMGLQQAEGRVLTLTWMARFAVLGLMVAAVPLFAIALRDSLHSPVPWMDATTTVLSVVAQWLMCQRCIETWFLWFVVDTIYIVLYLTKSIPFHAAILPVYLGLAVMGYLRWRTQRAAVCAV